MIFARFRFFQFLQKVRNSLTASSYPKPQYQYLPHTQNQRRR